MACMATLTTAVFSFSCGRSGTTFAWFSSLSAFMVPSSLNNDGGHMTAVMVADKVQNVHLSTTGGDLHNPKKGNDFTTLA